MGVLPQEVLHIGDDPHLDVVAAQQAGLQAVWLNREQKTWGHETHPAPYSVNSLQALCEAWPGH
jgi:FMN phosphatase YigB (HAD superfamily)